MLTDGDTVDFARLTEGELLGFSFGRMMVGLKAITPGAGLGGACAGTAAAVSVGEAVN